MREVEIGQGVVIGGGRPFVLVAGPCVIESEDLTLRVAGRLKEIARSLDVPLVFKASYDKANRTSRQSFRGPGLEKGLEILDRVKREFALPVLSDVHRFEEIRAASEVLDVVQVPAFLCRQTDFLQEVARNARVVNVKKGQFVAPWDGGMILDKAVAAGNANVVITERGYTFGYNNLVADMRSLPILRKTGYPVIFDATHSVQLPGGTGTASGGDREMAVFLARAAVAAGVDGLFFEVHPDPDRALCDGPNSLELERVPALLRLLRKIDDIVKEEDGK
ncbi:MAG TPA: 3-deoxy-8-phosphooctulonate synthase [Syntrophales bacterium]|nr:3-deoxy-8-phosphooctulonate synthase [Syntrophales bacterium]HQB30679.1 3-deoxy-8-phosphooctulonate synthase [Syntrophales bacterium]HQN78118.1 3-deoxy-8-phosphooctulonate synthase [Syntrophales bacterium]HQQ25918.1 3-deoxy-8-phosphooctulonate synthase [Syntrophales bacterium]